MSMKNSNILYQLYHSELQNLQGGEDWQVMCATTPGNMQGVHYNGPTSCADWVRIAVQSFGGEKGLTWNRDRFSAFGHGEYGT